MKRGMRTGGWIVLFAAAGMLALAQGQQSTGGNASGSHGQKQASKYKQEYGPQTASRRGDKMSAAPSGSSHGAGSAGQKSTMVKKRRKQESRKQ